MNWLFFFIGGVVGLFTGLAIEYIFIRMYEKEIIRLKSEKKKLQQRCKRFEFDVEL